MRWRRGGGEEEEEGGEEEDQEGRRRRLGGRGGGDSVLVDSLFIVVPFIAYRFFAFDPCFVMQYFVSFLVT